MSDLIDGGILFSLQQQGCSAAMPHRYGALATLVAGFYAPLTQGKEAIHE